MTTMMVGVNMPSGSIYLEPVYLLRRWDNTPHFPDLPGFPHHLHDGATNTVYPGVPVNIFSVLGQITQQLGSSSGVQT